MGHRVNHKRVARVMQARGLGIKPRRRFVRTTDRDGPVAGVHSNTSSGFDDH
jgi:putative transposase